MAEHDVIDGTVEDDAPDTLTEVPEENIQNPDQPEVPTWAFGQKAVLTKDQEMQVVRNRIAAHEEALATDELLLWEARLLGQDETAIVARINTTYALVQKYVNAFNVIYGGNENG